MLPASARPGAAQRLAMRHIVVRRLTRRAEFKLRAVVIGSLRDVVVVGSNDRMGVNVDVAAFANAHRVDAGGFPADVLVAEVVTFEMVPPTTAFAHVIGKPLGLARDILPLIRFQVCAIPSPPGRWITNGRQVWEKFILCFQFRSPLTRKIAWGERYGPDCPKGPTCQSRTRYIAAHRGTSRAWGDTCPSPLITARRAVHATDA
jgi:hypothetical protein